jgi:hypothetical protein
MEMGHGKIWNTHTLLTAPLGSAKAGGAKWFRFYKQIIY